MPTEIAKKIRLPRQSGIEGPQPFYALIVDDETLPVLSGATKTYDLLDNGISVIQSITKARQPLPDLDSIYFISPQRDTVERLLQDFKSDKKPMYRSVHIFWSTSIASEPHLIDIIATCPPLVSRIKSFVDFNLHFRAYEARAFHLNMPMALRQLLTKHSRPSPSLLREISSRIATVCLSMGDIPNIRFYNDGSNATLNREVAQGVQDYFQDKKFPQITKGKCELIIVDRSIDTCVLLVHEYTYQALAYDVLEIAVCNPVKGKTDEQAEDIYRYLNDKKEVVTVLLNESDELYVRYRHKHIASVITGVNDELKKFSQDNAAAQYKGKGAGAANSSAADIANAIRALPQYTEMLNKFLTHINMSENCFSTLNRTGIFRAGILEQDLATGVDKHGKSVQVLKILEELAKLVSDKSGIIMTEKVRLLLLYFTMMDGVQLEDRRKMTRAAGMSVEIEKIIDTFMDLELINSVSPNAADGQSTNTLKHVHRIHKNEDLLQFYKRKAKSAQYELSRFEPVVKGVLESSANKRLSRSQFPYVQDPDFSAAVGLSAPNFHGAGSGGGGRIRAAQYDWDWDTPDVATPAEDNNIAHIAGQGDRPKIILFCLGGIGFSEIRTAYEVTRSTNSDIYIGGTSIVTPPMLLNLLKADNTEL